MDLIQRKANEITKGLKFTVDLPENHPNGKAPMLDTQVWVERGRMTNEGWVGDTIRYGYYEKPTTNPKVFARQGAHGWRNKIATLAMEGVRRMRNMDPQSPMEERLEVMRGYAVKLKDSGYSTPERREVLKSGLIKFYPSYPRGTVGRT